MVYGHPHVNFLCLVDFELGENRPTELAAIYQLGQPMPPKQVGVIT